MEQGTSRHLLSRCRETKRIVACGSLACVEVVGQSVVERTIDRFLTAGIEAVTVLVETGFSSHLSFPDYQVTKIEGSCCRRLNYAIAETARYYVQSGIDHAFITTAETYAETDVLDFFYFHREARQEVTRAYDNHGWVDLWAVECRSLSESSLVHFRLTCCRLRHLVAIRISSATTSIACCIHAICGSLRVMCCKDIAKAARPVESFEQGCGRTMELRYTAGHGSSPRHTSAAARQFRTPPSLPDSAV